MLKVIFLCSIILSSTLLTFMWMRCYTIVTWALINKFCKQRALESSWQPSVVYKHKLIISYYQEWHSGGVKLQRVGWLDDMLSLFFNLFEPASMQVCAKKSPAIFYCFYVFLLSNWHHIHNGKQNFCWYETYINMAVISDVKSHIFTRTHYCTNTKGLILVQ